MKLFKTNYKAVITVCQKYFCFRLPSEKIDSIIIIIRTYYTDGLVAVKHT